MADGYIVRGFASFNGYNNSEKRGKRRNKKKKKKMKSGERWKPNLEHEGTVDEWRREGGDVCSRNSRDPVRGFVYFELAYISRGEARGREDGENDDDSNSKVIKINLLLPVLFVPSLPSLSSLVVVETLKREETIRV